MFYITVHLYGQAGVRGEFMEYERKALDIFRRHGGEVVVAYSPAPSDGTADLPDEIQVLRIEDRPAFDRFMGDPERVSMAAERNSVIRRTDVFLSGELVEYDHQRPSFLEKVGMKAGGKWKSGLPSTAAHIADNIRSSLIGGR